MLSLVSTIASSVLGIGQEYVKKKREIATAKHKSRMAAIESTANYERIMAEGSVNSWKDEWFTVMISAPFVTLFLGVLFDAPALVERTKEAFNVLRNDVPELYWTLLIIAFSASFGIKPAVKGITNMFTKSGR